MQPCENFLAYLSGVAIMLPGSVFLGMFHQRTEEGLLLREGDGWVTERNGVVSDLAFAGETAKVQP